MSGLLRERCIAAYLLVIFMSIQGPREAGAVAPSVRGASGLSALSGQTSAVVDLPADLPAPGEVLVGFKDGVTACADALFHKGQPFRSGTLDRSASLDLVFQKIRVQNVSAVFRESCDSLAPVAELRRRQATSRAGEDGLFHVYRLELGPGIDPARAAAALRLDPHVAFAEPNRLAVTAALPNDRFLDPARKGVFQRGSWAQPYADLWGLEQVRWGEVWRRQAKIWPEPARRGGGGVVVAVIDTGVDYRHPDLAAKIWKDAAGNPGMDLVDVSNETLALLAEAGFSMRSEEDYRTPDNDPSDWNGHGTHVAGILGARARNGQGIAGVSWNARIMPVRAGFDVFKASEGAHRGVLELDDLAAAIRWAAAQGADVINMSFGLRGEESPTLSLAIEYAASQGAVLVAAAGNEGIDGASTWPAAHPRVISVAATISSDRRIFFSNWGASVDIAAPGSDIVSTRAESTELGGSSGVVDARYIRASGTSMAAPFVAGAVALVLSAYPNLTPAEAAARVIATADPSPGFESHAGRSQSLGSGRLNLLRALTAPARPAFVLHGWEVLSDTDGDRQAEPGETVRVKIDLRNEWRDTRGASVRLVSDGPQVAVLSGALPAEAWPVKRAGMLTAELRVADGVSWGALANLRLEIRGAGVQQDLPLPLALRGPAAKAGWPAPGEKDADGMITSPALGDLDGDGDLEVFALSSRGDAFVREADGSLFPGWPISFHGNTEQSSPLAEDLDGDGDIELVFVRDRRVRVLDANGRDLPGWPRDLAAWVLCSPAAGDLNGDGRQEVVVVSDDATVHVFDAVGQMLPGWPKKVGKSSNTGPTLVDLDGAPGLEIVVGTSEGSLVALRADGSTPAGSWPARVGPFGPSSPAVADLDGNGEVGIIAASVTGRLFRVDRRGGVIDLGRLPGSYVFSSPVVGDLDGNGRPEIAIGSGHFDGTGFFSVIDGTGRFLPGWPVATAVAVAASPALADLDGDGRPDVVVPDMSGELHAWRADGKTLGGWPYDLRGGTQGAPVIADLDGDGTLEIVVGKAVSGVQGPVPMIETLEFGAASEKSAASAWLTFQGNPRRTGAPN